MHWLSICDPRILTKQCCSKVKVEHNSKREKWKLYKHKWQCKNNGTMMHSSWNYCNRKKCLLHRILLHSQLIQRQKEDAQKICYRNSHSWNIQFIWTLFSVCIALLQIDSTEILVQFILSIALIALGKISITFWEAIAVHKKHLPQTITTKIE